MKGNIVVSALAIVSLTLLELFALYKGIDGKFLAIVVMCISGLGGFHFGRIKDAVKDILR